MAGTLGYGDIVINEGLMGLGPSPIPAVNLAIHVCIHAYHCNKCYEVTTRSTMISYLLDLGTMFGANTNPPQELDESFAMTLQVCVMADGKIQQFGALGPRFGPADPCHSSSVWRRFCPESQVRPSKLRSACLDSCAA